MLGLLRTACLTLLAATSASAATLTVTHVDDNGPGSLRDALATANTNGEPDTIVFDPAVAGGTIVLTSSDGHDPSIGPTHVVVRDDGGNAVTIEGPGTAPGVAIDSAGGQRLFAVEAGSAASTSKTVPAGTVTRTVSRTAGEAWYETAELS